MAVDLQRLGHMLLTTGAGGGHHQHAFAAAMPASGPCYGAAVPSQRGHQPYANLFTLPLPPTSSSAAEQYSEFLAMAAADLAKKGVSPDGAQEMITKKRRRDERWSVLGAADVLAAHAQQQTIDVDRILLKHVSPMIKSPGDRSRKVQGVPRGRSCAAAAVPCAPCAVRTSACAPCAAAAQACPACGSAKNGSVCVNFS